MTGFDPVRPYGHYFWCTGATCTCRPVTADRVVARAVDSAFRCDVCGERCTSKRALDEHATAHPLHAEGIALLPHAADREVRAGEGGPPVTTAGTAGEGYRVVPIPYPYESTVSTPRTGDDPREPGRRHTDQQRRQR